MASNRHLGRIVVLQSLFEHDFRHDVDEEYSLDEVIKRNINQYKKSLNDTKFVDDFVRKVVEMTESLDLDIAPLAPDWPVDQIARVDRLILRMSLYELKYGGQTPPKVVINEAVELAKEFGGDNSGKFINGVLGTAYRKLHPEETKNDKKPEKKASK
ncbi:transcription antitermination factor NusB [Candidatus Saccharibacteria bacterium]|nr:transcription antitermination factor NusB [Candidatus Saccharibacteria bacterium]